MSGLELLRLNGMHDIALRRTPSPGPRKVQSTRTGSAVSWIPSSGDCKVSEVTCDRRHEQPDTIPGTTPNQLDPERSCLMQYSALEEQVSVSGCSLSSCRKYCVI